MYGQDEKGANLDPVPGAKIELLSAKSGTVLATATADSPGGYFQIKDLPPADYAYRVTAAGFKTEDEKRGFKVPQSSLEYVHDFILTRPPPKRERCDVPVLIVKRVSTGTNDADAVRLPAASASLLLRPNSKSSDCCGVRFEVRCGAASPESTLYSILTDPAPLHHTNTVAVVLPTLPTNGQRNSDCEKQWGALKLNSAAIAATISQGRK